jgi:transcriptional regulator of acetoin/glycerol metabolism
MDWFDSSVAIQRPWVSVSDISSEVRKRWERMHTLLGDRSRQMHHFISMEEAALIIKNNKDLIQAMKKEMAFLNEDLCRPYIFAVTDPNAMIMEMSASPPIMPFLEAVNLGVSASMTMEHAGLNAISMSMQLEDSVVVQGNEHALSLFEGWTCIGVPVHVEGKIKGYVGLGIMADLHPILVVTSLQNAVKRVQIKLSYMSKTTVV